MGELAADDGLDHFEYAVAADAEQRPLYQRSVVHQYQLPPRPRTASKERTYPDNMPLRYTPSPSPTTSSYPTQSVSDESVDSPYQRKVIYPPRSASREPKRSFTSPYYANGVQSRPSEASRLRALENGYRSQSPDARSVEAMPRMRPGTPQRLMEAPGVLYAANTFPLSMQREDSPTRAAIVRPSRARGISNASAHSPSGQSTNFSIPLRPSASIPDYTSTDLSYVPRQRNMPNISYRGAQPVARPDSKNSHRREPLPRTPGFDSEEFRASIRSAMTTGSSYLEASGTERSSVVTKSSSATSITARDEGMSVDDAIGMYENGFTDSEVEDYDDEKHEVQMPQSYDQPAPESDDVNQMFRTRAATTPNPSLPVLSEDLLPPPTHMVARDSAAIFGPDRFRAPSPAPPKLSSLSNPPANSTPAPALTQPEENTYQNRDRYGFKKKSQYISVDEYDAWNGPYSEYLERRRKKWMLLLKEAGLPTDDPQKFPAKSGKVKRFVRKGIPPEWRGAAWFWYAGGPAIVEKHRGLYEQLVIQAQRGDVNPNDEEIIERDLNRTFPDNIKFKCDSPLHPGATLSTTPEPETETVQALRRVLRAFSLYNPKIGYCQSLNFLAGLLLLFVEEEKAFWMLNIITRVYLPGTHEVNLEGANVDLGVLMMSIRELMPAVWAKIGGELDGTTGDGKVSMRLPPITLCTTAWFMSCFIGTLPMESALRVWDSFFYEGSKTLFRIALTIFKVGEVEIRAVNDPMEIFQVVQTIPRKLIDANGLLEACFRRRHGFSGLSQATIEQRRAERRAGYAAERAKANGQANLGRKRTLFRRGAKPKMAAFDV